MSRLSRIFKRLNPFARSRGLRARDYIFAAMANPKAFARAVKRFLNRRSHKVEALVRASENAALRDPAPPRLQTFDALLARLSKEVGLVELSRSDTYMRVAVGDVDVLTATILCATYPAGAVLSVDGKKAHLGMEKIKSRIQDARSIDIHFNSPELETLRIALESYHETEPGKWVSPNTGNRLMRAIYGDHLGKPGFQRAIDILGAPSLRARMEEAPVDAVYTWVNHNDTEWQALYNAWTETPLSHDHLGKSKDADALSRFHNNDELRYSLRSLDQNLPWLRRIFVFSNCAAPDWLATDHPRLTWVRHEEVIPAQFLPTFNSHVIESFLHRIPGLADRFIYLNDDFFVMSPQGKIDFFTVAGQSHAWLEAYGMVSGPVRAGDPDYLNAARNSAALVRETFGFAPTQLHKHVPYALLRPVLHEIETRFQPRIDAFRVNKFRRANDVNIPSFLYHHYAMGCGKSVSASKDSIMVKSDDLMWGRRLKEAEDAKYAFVCINEGGADGPPSGWHTATTAFLHRKFPTAAIWERRA